MKSTAACMLHAECSLLFAFKREGMLIRHASLNASTIFLLKGVCVYALEDTENEQV